MTLVDTLAFGVGVLAVGVVVLLGTRFAIALANDHDVSESAGIAGRWFAIGVGAVVGAIGVGLVNVGEFGAVVTDLVGGMPTFFASLGTTALGVLALEGAITLTTSQYVGIAALIVGGVILLREASERAA